MRRILLMTAALFTGIITVMAQDAEATLAKILETIEKDGVRCNFSLPGQDGGVKATLLMKGVMFCMSTPENSSWFDGKTLWTGNLYNGKVDEVYISEPTLKEMEDNLSNPYLAIRGHKGFNISMPDSRTLQLKAVDTNGRNGIMSIKVSLGPNGMPLSAKVSTVNAGDGGFDIIFDKFETKVTATQADFTYPAGKWPEAEIIDLR